MNQTPHNQEFSKDINEEKAGENEKNTTVETLEDLRLDYTKGTLLEADLAPTPMDQLIRWMEDARKADLPEPSAFTLTTISAEGIPSARVVLAKGLSEEGIVFYTNYESRKGLEALSAHGVAATFFWPGLERQVRIVGKAEKISQEESARYFHSRPRGSQLAAYISPQSKEVDNRQELESMFEQAEKKLEGQEVPLPSTWGGVLIRPLLEAGSYFEFWQGRKSRLHDRLVYKYQSEGYTITRLAP
jgi:pyridoxamine 5'-phosphate oxidase